MNGNAESGIGLILGGGKQVQLLMTPTNVADHLLSQTNNIRLIGNVLANRIRIIPFLDRYSAGAAGIEAQTEQEAEAANCCIRGEPDRGRRG